MRVAAVSDLHGHLPAVPACDLLLLGGDLCPKSDHSPARQAAWLDGPFRAWLDAAPAREVVAVAGNHDFVFEKVPGLVPAGLRWTYLQDSGCRVGPYNVWGSPWQPVFFDWAFNAPPAKRAAAWAMIPDDTHVVVLHGPPLGAGDSVAKRWAAGDRDDTAWPAAERVGCPHLRERLNALPRLGLAVYGHIHTGHGLYPHPAAAPTRLYANVSLVDETYTPTYPVRVFDLPAPDSPAWAAGGWWGEGGRP